ncbi:MAG TPA: DUF5522 domain-containing protein [Acidimicrobiia bacterium]
MRLPEPLVTPAPSRLDPSHPHYDVILLAHRRALSVGEPLYPDPITGLWVMTAEGLWERGSCCETGCRHCPWAER